MWGLEIGILIKTMIGILLGLVSRSFYKNIPFQNDSIIVTEDKIEIFKNNKKQIILIEEIKSINSNSRLSIQMKNGEQRAIIYSDWNMRLEKTREFKSVIKKQIDNSISSNNTLNGLEVTKTKAS